MGRGTHMGHMSIRETDKHEPLTRRNALTALIGAGLAVGCGGSGKTSESPSDGGSDGGPDGGRSPYAAAVAKAVGTMGEDEANGIDPGKVADVVVEVLASRHPPRRVSVGKLDERIGITAKRLLPYRLFEQAAKGSLGV